MDWTNMGYLQRVATRWVRKMQMTDKTVSELVHEDLVDVDKLKATGKKRVEYQRLLSHLKIVIQNHKPLLEELEPHRLWGCLLATFMRGMEYKTIPFTLSPGVDDVVIECLARSSLKTINDKVLKGTIDYRFVDEGIQFYFTPS